MSLRNLGYLICLIFSSCVNSGKISTVSKDSLVYIEKSRIDTLYIPAGQAEITLSHQLIRDTVWNYLEKTEGRAKVQIIRQLDSIIVRAACDSIIHPVLSTEKISHQSRQMDAHTASDKNKDRMWMLIALMMAFMLGILIRK